MLDSIPIPAIAILGSTFSSDLVSFSLQVITSSARNSGRIIDFFNLLSFNGWKKLRIFDVSHHLKAFNWLG